MCKLKALLRCCGADLKQRPFGGKCRQMAASLESSPRDGLMKRASVSRPLKGSGRRFDRP